MDPIPYLTAVREMPLEERPRERLEKLGPDALRDAELLAVLFRSGTRKLGAVALAEQVLAKFGDLRALKRASLKELQSVPGLGRVKAIEIKAALELGSRLHQHRGPERVRIKSSEDVKGLLMGKFKDLETEVFKVLLLNTKNEVLQEIDVSRGGLDGTSATPGEVFRHAIREGAHGVLVCHNHPSGDPEPSRDDIALTRRLSDAAALLGIRFLDHVVFGDGRIVSLKERDLF